MGCQMGSMNWFKPTYNVLMRIHEDVEAILLGLAKYGYGVFYPLLVIFARSIVLYRLPREDVTNGVVAPAS
jgi:hypothetical protein